MCRVAAHRDFPATPSRRALSRTAGYASPGDALPDSAGAQFGLRVTSATQPLRPHEIPVRIRPAIPVKLPDIPDLADLVEVEVGGDELFLVR